MANQTDLLDRVVAALTERRGDLHSVAVATGISYDTVLRIRNRENDPGYSKVRKLAAHLFPASNRRN
jgi:hypothetical protein